MNQLQPIAFGVLYMFKNIKKIVVSWHLSLKMFTTTTSDITLVKS